MDWARAKNLLLAVLVLTNLIMGGVWLSREWEAHTAQREAKDALCRLLAERGVEARPGQIPDVRTYTYHWQRSSEEEAAAARLLLGDAESAHIGTVSLYEGALGRAEFRMNGEFLIQMHRFQTDVVSIMGRMGFAAGRGNATQGYTQLLNGFPVFDNIARMLPGEGLMIQGRWYWGEALPVNAELCHSAGYSLLALTEILEVGKNYVLDGCELGFRDTQIEPEVIRLTPYWRFTLSGDEYYINAVTGNAG